MTVCTACKSTEILYEESLGMSYCKECGNLITENAITSTISFEDSKMTGAVYSYDSNLVSYKNKIININNNKINQMIKNIATLLEMNNEEMNGRAYAYYKLLLPYNISKGKNIYYILSVCLYIVWREENLPIFLIDFSLKLKIDLFKIGKIFKRSLRFLDFNLSHSEPFIFLEKYFIQLKFKNRKILQMANNILNLYKNDWLVTGRRPNNLIGAALLISGRIYEEVRDIEEVALVLSTTVNTINERLKELGKNRSEQPVNFKINEDYAHENYANTKITRVKIEMPADEIFHQTEDSASDYILNEDEIRDRELMWDEQYKEYLEERERKKKKKKTVRKKRPAKIFNSLEESIKCTLEETKLSKKIDYNILNEFFK